MFAVTAKRALANAARNATVPAAGPAHGWLAADLGAVASTASRGAGVSTWAAARAALVATYWRGGDAAKAEDTWLDLCQIDDAQCGKYGDKGWLLSYRKWTPGLADAMQDFLKLRS